MTFALALRGFCIVCFLGAGVRHLADVWQGGWLPYGEVPLWSNVFWTMLVLLDPLAAVLLALRSRLGAVLALLVMVADVAINSYWACRLGASGGVGALTLPAQAFFLGVVLAGFPLLRALQPDARGA